MQSRELPVVKMGAIAQACAAPLGRESCGGRQKIPEEYGNPQVKHLFCSCGGGGGNGYFLCVC